MPFAFTELGVAMLSSVLRSETAIEVNREKINDMTIEKRIEKALAQRKEGYNCAQTVFMAFPDITGIDDNTAAIMTAPLGAGVASGEICGVANAMAMVQGFITNDASPEGKKKAMPAAKRLLSEFATPFGGCLSCRELKGKCGKSCEELIASGISLLHKSINSHI